VRAFESRALRHGHAEALLPMIERVMREAGLTPSQLGAVAAAIGPGGFTGIRVGLAAAHGIALAVGARLIGISSFAAVAARIAGIGEGACETLLVALDSRRAELYVQLFAGDAGSPLAAPQALLEGELADYVARVAVGRGGGFTIDHELGSFGVRRLGAFRPLIGAVSGVIVSFLVQTSLVPIDKQRLSIEFYVVVAFLAGFSERWTKVVLAGAMRTIDKAGDDEKPQETAGVQPSSAAT